MSALWWTGHLSRVNLMFCSMTAGLEQKCNPELDQGWVDGWKYSVQSVLLEKMIVGRTTQVQIFDLLWLLFKLFHFEKPRKGKPWWYKHKRNRPCTTQVMLQQGSEDVIGDHLIVRVVCRLFTSLSQYASRRLVVVHWCCIRVERKQTPQRSSCSLWRTRGLAALASTQISGCSHRGTKSPSELTEKVK